ncbi:sensor histidine kinase [Chromatium okenii]|uniref:sensor histidine kinase n=1 Tax=Chromatium okenii TaxID=61644 RepID=UPI001F5B83AD|nr:ATP-binding protein [Chromatium okenii]
MSLYQRQFEASGRQLVLALQPQTWISGDPDLLRQVLDNLLRNALEANAPAGLIDIRVERSGQFAQLRIANDGLELAAADVMQIVEPWFTTKTTGTGLGLAISQRIITAHAGQLTLQCRSRGGYKSAFNCQCVSRSDGNE